MLPSTTTTPRLAAALTCLLAMSRRASAQLYPMDLCATMNTGTGSGYHSDWQSDELCYNYCNNQKSALAIVKGNLCWCSNYAPIQGAQVSLDNCRDPCPGYPNDVCGGDGTWGYMRIKANTLSGTTSVSSSSQTGRPTSSAGTSQTSVATSASSTRTSSSPTTAETSETTSQSTVPMIQTVTAGGTTKVVTVMPSTTAGSADSTADSSSNGGIGTGAAVGIAVGIIAILVAGIVAGFLYMRRKRRREQDAGLEGASSPRDSAAPAMSYAPTGHQPGHRRPTDATWVSDHSSGRRSSMLMPTDPRMKSTPGLYGMNVNRSHDSFLSMQDNQDYSRPVHEPPKVLKVTNASPDDSD